MLPCDRIVSLDTMNKQCVLVAGGTGFLGRHVCKKLQEKGIPFIATSLSGGTDFRNFDQTLQFFKRYRPTTVMHCAAYVGGIKFGLAHAGEVYYNNILMSTNLIEAARFTGTQRFISPIANCAYPDVVDKDYKEDEFWNGPLNYSVMVYGMVRKAQWAQTWAYARQYNMKFVNIVLPNMYGPEDRFDEERSHALGALLMKIVQAKKESKPEVVVWGTGNPIREWLHVEDGAEALMKALDIGYFIEPVNVGVGKGISIKNLAEMIQRIVGYSGKLIFDTSKPDGALYKVMDTKRLEEVYKWKPAISLEKGIKETYNWYRHQK